MMLPVPMRDQILAELPIACEIKPLNRPRALQGGRGVWQPLKNQQELFQALKPFKALHIDVACFVDITIVFRRPVTNKEPHVTRKNRGDVDNLAKAVNDALVKAEILADDLYIVGQSLTKAYGSDDFCMITIWSVAPNCPEVPCRFSSDPTNSKPQDRLLGIF